MNSAKRPNTGSERPPSLDLDKAIKWVLYIAVVFALLNVLSGLLGSN